MATYPIRLFGDPALKQRSREVAELDLAAHGRIALEPREGDEIQSSGR